MENLDIEKFNPKKAELVEVAKQYEGLVIAGVDDKIGYAKVDEARKDLKKKRVEIQATGKELRADAVKFQKAVIAYEDDLVNIIEPLEKKLKSMQEAVDEEKERAGRVALLPVRINRLAEIEMTGINENVLLSMDDLAFESYFNEEKGEWLHRKEEKIRADEARIQKEKELEMARNQARIEAEREAKARELKAVKDAEEKAEREKQAIIDENNRKEAERIAEEKRKEQARIEAEVKAKEDEEKEKAFQAKERAKQEKQASYKKWLAENGYEENGEYNITRDGHEITLWKKVSKYDIE
jgi:hypothetical protein